MMCSADDNSWILQMKLYWIVYLEINGCKTDFSAKRKSYIVRNALIT